MLVMALDTANWVLAAASSCFMIAQPDDRAYCLARQNQRASDCVAIANTDLRTRCKVELGQEKSQCVTISNPKDKALCVASGQQPR
jgi:hypothetical protein